MSALVETGDVVEVLARYPDNAFDAVLCDPPYGLSFMGKRWDYDVPSVDLWREVLRVCKPGAPLLAAFGTRTYHRGVVRIEDAGWDIRDSIVWMYGSGFPKSLDVSKALDAAAGAEREVTGVAGRTGGGRACMNDAPGNGRAKDYLAGEFYSTAPATDAAREWSGYGTALKPAHEPYVLARKPLDGTVAANVARWGVGALAIDACRVEGPPSVGGKSGDGLGYGGADGTRVIDRSMTDGRWPANVILDEGAGALLDAQTGARRSAGNYPSDATGRDGATSLRPTQGKLYADSGGASRFFYCAKASRAERDAGCEDLSPSTGGEATGREDDSAGTRSPRAGAGRTGGARNVHPTVKPLALCEYLARLILPPRPGAILVPFAGSGSEMIGALRAGWPSVVGIEREPLYVRIAEMRLAKAAA